jgi:hypothetical protein
MDLRPGQSVRIADGVFAGMDATVVYTLKPPGSSQELVRVQLQVLGRPVPGELEPWQLEGGPAPRREVPGRPPPPPRGHCPVTIVPEGGVPPAEQDRPAAPLTQDAVPPWDWPWQAKGKQAGGMGAVARWALLGALAGLVLGLVGARLADGPLGPSVMVAVVGAFAGSIIGVGVALVTQRKGGTPGSAP